MRIGDLGSINEKYEMFVNFSQSDDIDDEFTFSAKDNLTSIDYESTAGSKILKGYKAPFDATPIKRMREAGGALIGKTNMDEFGFGTFCTNSAFGIPKNPFDLNRSCGGSSGGSACAAAVLDDHVSIGVSTGGSIVCPASFCGVYGLAPSYGRVSRYGLIDYGNSLDKVGLLSFKASDLRRCLPIISGKDPHDPTSYVQPELKLGQKKLKSVAIPKEAVKGDGISKDVMECFEKSLEMLRSMSIDVEYISMPTLKYSIPAYYVIATSEASTNLARFCGMRYGQQDGDLTLKFDDYFTSFRSKYFGDEAKRRILLGTFTRMVGYADRYYNKALQVREAIIADYKEQFKRFDAVVTPTMPFISPRFDDISKMSALDSYKADFLTVPPNITGMPHMSAPCGYSDGMPIGLLFTSDHWNEDILIDAAERWDSAFDVRHAEVKI
ncbi:amidase family protein [Candidatus Methanarcanum hacksteinii]|uniref:amidase family protein n=1 Tax=Candidatus Methanarcanum hacksteinii TaxID=2911857 RepID=UPI0037DC2FC7